jgi:hypothetical protein
VSVARLPSRRGRSRSQGHRDARIATALQKRVRMIEDCSIHRLIYRNCRFAGAVATVSRLDSRSLRIRLPATYSVRFEYIANFAPNNAPPHLINQRIRRSRTAQRGGFRPLRHSTSRRGAMIHCGVITTSRGAPSAAAPSTRKFHLSRTSLDGNGPTGVVDGVKGADGSRKAVLKGPGCSHLTISNAKPDYYSNADSGKGGKGGHR